MSIVMLERQRQHVYVNSGASGNRVSIGRERAHTEYMGHNIVTTADVLKKKREDLKTKRDSLFQKYTKHPNDYHFALEIKIIDDEIAECVQKEQETSGRKVRR